MQDLLRRAGATVDYRSSQPGKSAVFSKPERKLHSRLATYIEAAYPRGLYRHQAQAIDLSLAGHNVALCTATASGKSECFFFPVLNACLRDPNVKAIFIYPLLALANDQFGKLRRHCSMLHLGDIARRFDGSVSAEQPTEALEHGRILLCTPDVLHATILREQSKPLFASFLKHVRFVVMDECHVYSGAFGSNVAYVIRRLRQALKRQGGTAQFIAASATSSNPQEHLRLLTGLGFSVVDETQNGAPTGDRVFYMVTPSSSPSDYALELMRVLSANRIRFLTFFDSRRGVERELREARSTDPKFAREIRAYRSGYEAEDRKVVEEGLRKGTLCGVIATSALELGIDIPEMDVCMLVGVPSTKIQLMQRAGRVGRRHGRPGHVVIVRGLSALDDYYFAHPKELFDKNYEKLVVNLDNEPLMMGHWACAKAESNVAQQPELDPGIFGTQFTSLEWRSNDFSIDEGILMDNSPHFGVQIRCISDDSYEIRISHPEGEKLGTITHSQLLREAYPQAVYLHMGKPYRVREIRYSQKKVVVDPRCSMYVSTSPTSSFVVTPRANTSGLGKTKLWPKLDVRQGYFNVSSKVTGYREKGQGRAVNVEYDRPLLRYFVTQGTVISIRLPKVSYPALIGLGNALANCYPLIQPCADDEIGVYARQTEPGGEIYLFDNTPGGLALTWPVVDHFERLLQLAAEQVRACPNCSRGKTKYEGCLRCVRRMSFTPYESKELRQHAMPLLELLLAESQVSAARVTESRLGAGMGLSKGSGRTMLATGAKVVTGSQEEGVVVSSTRDGLERCYQVRVGGQTRQFVGSRLCLVEGEILRWCTTCGVEGLDLSETECPVCSSIL